jgi:osmotically-inducible protein OsmY
MGDVWINGDLITPEVKDGQVTLTGTIGSAISKSRAYDDAWVNGVTMGLDQARTNGHKDGELKKQELHK